MVPLGDKVANLVPYCPLWGSNKGFHPRGILVFNHRKSRLPPGPYPLPIIENLLELRNKPHLSLTTLSKRYGPLMSLKLGSITTIVVSSPKMAKEFFQIHDQLFSGRSVPMSTQVVNHSKHSMVFLPAGDKWRRLRRITKEYLFSAQCVDRSENLRKKKVQELLQHVTQCCTNNKAVNVDRLSTVAKKGSSSTSDDVSSAENDLLDALLSIHLKDDTQLSKKDINHLFMDMTTKFDKLVKFEGQDFRRWQKKMHFLLTTLKVVYVLSTPSPEWHEDETLETTRKRMKWENDDNICRGHILNGQCVQHNLMMDEAISVAVIIDKLPPSWKDFK
nr:cytochrome P450 [Tanacetum cinerariifolium]